MRIFSHRSDRLHRLAYSSRTAGAPDIRSSGLTRSDAGARALVAAGAEPYHGTIDDPESLRAGAAAADAVIHTAFDHNFANFAANCEKDQRVIRSLSDALKGSAKPLVITSGTGMGTSKPGQPATEDVFDADNPNPRKASNGPAPRCWPSASRSSSCGCRRFMIRASRA
ncbi:MAG: hypothetical protein WDN06_22530 [Asticcacaulis sp.]